MFTKKRVFAIIFLTFVVVLAVDIFYNVFSVSTKRRLFFAYLIFASQYPIVFRDKIKQNIKRNFGKWPVS
ncbi:MAG: hypothetical protein CVT96_05520 [Bacteroidetes bacterium HGW-Bacteroidetes-13]|nr:MAG: hypothetical protein CVT96_05520 [Bacteroidetes bacterium HGW-Bacteroidetes-13]